MKEERIVIRVSEDEKKSFEMSAELAGVSLSTWARDRLRRISARELENVGLAAPFIEKLVAEFRSD